MSWVYGWKALVLLACAGFPPAGEGGGNAVVPPEDLQASAQQFESALQRNPRSLVALAGLARIRSLQARYPAAVYYLRQAVAIAPQDLSIRFALAAALEGGGEVDQAIGVLKDCAASNPESSETHFNLANAYAHKNDFARAATEYGEAYRLDPTNGEALRSKAKALVASEQHAAALPVIEACLRRHGESFETRLLEGMAQRGLGNFAEAERRLRRAVEMNPEQPDARYELGLALFRLGKAQDARRQLEKAKQLSPRSTEIRYQFATVLRYLGEEKAARGELRSFHSLKQEQHAIADASRAVNLGNELLAQGDARGAADAYRQALKADGRSAKTHYNLSLALSRIADRVGQQEAIEKAIECDPNFAPAHSQLGLIYLDQGRVAEAEREMKTALSIDPQLAEAQNNLSVIYGRRGNHEEALRLLRAALRSDPKYVQARLNLGLMLASQEKLAEAEAELRAASELSPAHAGVFTALAMVQQRRGRPEQAISSFERAARLDSSSAEGHFNYGIALADCFRFQEALTEFSSAAHLAPNSGAGHYRIGRLLVDLGRYEEARPHLEAAFRLMPDYAPLLCLLALTEKRQAHGARSVLLLNKVASLDPDNRPARYLLARVLFSLGREQEGIDHLSKAMGLDGRNAATVCRLAAELDWEPAKSICLPESHSQSPGTDQQSAELAESLSAAAALSAEARDWSGAVDQLKRAIALCGPCNIAGKLRKNLGLAHARSGALQDALRELRAASELNRSDPDVAKLLRTVEAAGARP